MKLLKLLKLLKLDSQRAKPALLPALRTVSLSVAALLLCLLALGQPTRADVFTSDATIDYAIGSYTVALGSSTVSLLSGGSIAGRLTASDTSTINISGGSVTEGLVASSSGIFNVSGGSIGGGLVAYGTSTINISGGSITGRLSAYDTSSINLSGGFLGGDLLIYGSTTVSLSGGSLGGNLFAYGTSTINLSGGSLGGELYINGGRVILSGGSLGTDVYINNAGTLDVYGTGLSLTGPFGPQYSLPYYTLSGTLSDGTAINKPVYLNGAAVSQVVLHNTDPFVGLKSQVQALGDAGALNKGNTNALLTKLSAAQSAAASGDVAGERDSLTAFINQVREFVRTGKLTTAQGTSLVSAAQAILNGLG